MLGEEVLNGNLDGLELPCDFRPQIGTLTTIFFGQAWRKAAAQSSDGMRKRLQQKENPRGGRCI